MEKAMTAITTEAPITTIRPKMGFTLIEVLICLSMLAAMSAIATSLYGQQIAHSQLNEVSHAFIQDAHLARQLSRQMDKTITLKPLGHSEFRDWSHGWAIVQGAFSSEEPLQILKQYPLQRGHLKGRIQVAHDSLKESQQFTDMSAPNKARHISFESGKAALLNNGGFVANRIIWQHSAHSDMQRHLILGPGGRWRVCDPSKDHQKCI
jgi:type IV fimbrial biogenesis protein FimT